MTDVSPLPLYISVVQLTGTEEGWHSLEKEWLESNYINNKDTNGNIRLEP